VKSHISQEGAHFEEKGVGGGESHFSREVFDLREREQQQEGVGMHP
jgi:hypothetical protein